MARKLDPEIAEALKIYGLGHEACWDCHGTWVVHHWALEQIAAKAGIRYEQPTVLVAEKDAAAILVTGYFVDQAGPVKSEWSIGEAVIGQNYKVSGKQAAYPFAMAEKRAKDRVILKLIGLHGLAYSDVEADEFVQPEEEKRKAKQKQAVQSEPVDLDAKQRADFIDEIYGEIQQLKNRDQAREWWARRLKDMRDAGVPPEEISLVKQSLVKRFEEPAEAA